MHGFSSITIFATVQESVAKIIRQLKNNLKKGCTVGYKGWWY